MKKRIFYIVLPLLVGVLLGYHLRDLKSPPVQTNSPSTEALREEATSGSAFDRSPRIKKEAATRRPGDFNNLIVQGKGNYSMEDWINRLRCSTDDLSLSEIQAALAALPSVADIHDRARVHAAIVRRWAELDGRGAFEYANSLGEGEMKVQAMAAVAEVLAHSDPQFLAAQAATMPSTRSSRELIQELTSTWAATDVYSALAWAEKLPEGLSKNDALAIIRSQLGRQNPEEAAAQLSQLPPGDSRNSLISNLAAQWGLRDPAQATAWANSLPPAEKTLAMSGLAGAWAQCDPIAAGNLVVKLPEGEAQNQAALAVALSWAGQNPAAAAAWVLQFPEVTLQQGIREVVNTWANMDSGQALDWVKALPEGTTRDAALKSYVESIAYWTPDKAAEITGLINDQTTRNESLDITMRSWSETDPATARNWLAKLNVPEESKVRLQAFLPMN